MESGDFITAEHCNSTELVYFDFLGKKLTEPFQFYIHVCSGSSYCAYEGFSFLNLCGGEPGTIRQSFAATVGKV